MRLSRFLMMAARWSGVLQAARLLALSLILRGCTYQPREDADMALAGRRARTLTICCPAAGVGLVPLARPLAFPHGC